jgi:hypothetical protein
MTTSTVAARTSRAAALLNPDERVVWALLAALLVIRIILSRHLIDEPGLQYDETLFVNAATLHLPGVGVAHSVAGIPVMIFPYIGALKSWLYEPIFKVFGTSPTTVRMPAVLALSVGLGFLYLAVRDLVNRPVAILVFVVLCFDNSVFWLTRDDVGPSAIELLLKCFVLWCAARFARAPGLRWVALILVSLALGVFNKLNFIWVVNAATAASVIVFLRYRASLRGRARWVAVWLGGLAVIYAGFAAYYFGDHINTLVPIRGGTSLGALWPQFAHGTEAILSGTWFFSYALAPVGARPVVAWIVIALFAAGMLASVAAPATRNLAVACMSLGTVLIAIQNWITPQATAGWHYIEIYPYVTVVAGYGAYALARAALRRDARVNAALACLAIGALTYNGVLMAKYFRALSVEPSNAAWSPAIYGLSNYLYRRGGVVFTADWGISNPLFTLRPGNEYREISYALEDQAPANLRGLNKWLASMADDESIVTHVPGKLVFPLATSDLFKATHGHLHLVKTITGRTGVPVFQVYAYH